MSDQGSSMAGRGLSRRVLLRRTRDLCVGSVLLAACGQPAGSAGQPAPKGEPAANATAPTTAAAAAPTTPAAAATTRLVFWRHQYDPTDKVFREIIFPDAQAKFNVDIDYQIQRGDDYNTKMLPQIASGVGPDIFEAAEGFRVKFARAGIYAPIDYTPWGGKDKWEAFWEKGVLEALRVDGQDFNVPLEWTAIPVNLFVNAQHAEEAGIAADIAKYQQTPISWAELGPWAAKMTKRDASGRIIRDGFMIQHGYGPDRTYAFWEPYFRQAGGQMVSDDGKTSLLNSEQGMAAMQNLYDYVFKYGASMLRPQDKESGSAKLPKEETSSTTGMSQWAYGTFKQLAPDKWQNIKSLLAPQFDSTKPRYYSGPGNSYGVFAKSPQREVAFKFLHLAAADHGSDLSDGGIVAPVVGWTDKYAGLKTLPDADVWTKMSREAIPLVRSQPEVLTDVQRTEGFQRAFEAVMFTKADIRAEMDRWNKDVQDALTSL